MLDLPAPTPGPFIDWLLDLIQELCRPARTGWRHDLAERLRQRLERAHVAGELLSPDTLNEQKWRINALEAAVAEMRAQLLKLSEPKKRPASGELETDGKSAALASGKSIHSSGGSR